MMKNSFYVAMLLLLASLSVICQAYLLAESFVVEFQKEDAGSSIQSFSIRRDLTTLSLNSSDIVDTNGYAGSGLPPEDETHGFNSYRLKTTLIESIPWQLIYATHLLVAYELTLITHDTPLSAKAFLWITVEAFVTLGWLLKSYRNSDSLLFKPMEQIKAATMVTQGDDLFTITTMMLPGNGQQQGQQQSGQEESSGQPASGGTTSQLTGFLTSPLSSDSGGGNEDPEQHQQHTFDLNCYVDSCNGVCIFRPSSDSRESAQGSLNSEESSTGDTGPTSGQSSYPLPEISYNVQIQNDFDEHINQQEPIPVNPNLRLINAGAVNRIRNRRNECHAIVIGLDGEQRPCGMILRSVRMLWLHRSKHHARPHFCDVRVAEEDGGRRLCGKIFGNTAELLHHKLRHAIMQNRRLHGRLNRRR
ncbi:hypothetical protein [Endozoicomonas sp. 8E]|uniref:hypothetical protein n=1 Tax=Endozoicomonas sp. 8E TaxID=3035692 RepID=UPI0029392594|nr:hypothetical protein [Endozoicomonas sp. 8E]WOG28496.1 hypothetical protein P6910_02235 [Endozoicomonas sp. 8E]